MEIIQKNIEISEGPAEINEENVVYWSRHCRELKGRISEKALKFLKYNCIQYVKDVLTEQDISPVKLNAFICLPLNTKETHIWRGVEFSKKPFSKDYNESEYLIWKENKRWICECQGWQSAERDDKKRREDGCQCSHILALFLAFRCKIFNKSHGATEEQIQPDR